jgi:hypothetical protein
VSRGRSVWEGNIGFIICLLVVGRLLGREEASYMKAALLGEGGGRWTLFRDRGWLG